MAIGVLVRKIENLLKEIIKKSAILLWLCEMWDLKSARPRQLLLINIIVSIWAVLMQ